MKKSVGFLIILIILSACSKPAKRIDYSEKTSVDTISMSKIVADTTKSLVSGLPIFFDSTEYLLHPIGYVSIQNSNNRGSSNYEYSSSGDYYSDRIVYDNNGSDYFAGNLLNIVFENIHTGKQNLLTKKALNIFYVEYKRQLAKKIHKHFIIYNVNDKDKNKDGKIDNNDINALYISKIDGSGFEKLSPDLYNYIDGVLIIEALKYYFRTIEDTNKDGLFQNGDKYHYYFIDFSTEPYKVKEYNPLELITK